MTHTETQKIGDTVVEISGSGTPLVFVHGFTTTAEFWREQVTPFSASHQVIRINLPGHGTSPHPTTRNYTIEAFSNDVLKVYKTLSLQDSILIGLSMGGTIAQHFTLSYPELIKALVLVGATPHGLGDDVNVDNVLQAIASLGVVAASQNVIDRSFGSNASAALLNFAKQEVSQTPAFVAQEAIASLNASDSRSQLSKISIPTMIVVGAQDIITPPSESAALAQGIPNSQLEIIADAGHFPMLEQADAFNHLLAGFLTQQSI